MNYFRLDFLLLHKWVLLNFLGMLITFFLHQQGWITTIITADISFITPAILVLVLLGIILSGLLSFTISREMKEVKRGNIAKVLAKFYSNPDKFDFNDSKNLDSLKLLFSSRIIFLRHIAWALVLMGLIGTVIGFIIVLMSIDPSAIADISKLPEVMGNITNGLGVALYTTLAGSIGNLWILINYNMLSTSTVQLYSYIITNHEVIKGD